ncbi:MAG TPA: hypothetical protein PLJ31_19515, partial [Armatimonadota bacterium]|nr:hypothetical protein [Armatimonadota bacterium]
MSRRRQLAAALVAALALGTAGARAAKIDLGSIGDAVKIMGIGFAVKTFGGQINQAINTVLMQN